MLIFGLLLGSVAVTKAQFISAQDVPAEVHQDFTVKFPDQKRVDWEKDGNKYKASFKVNRFDYQLVYDNNGKLVTQQSGIPTASLPTDVTSGISKNFPELKIAQANKIEEKGKTSYKVVLKDENSATENVTMTPEGMVIKTEIDEE